MSSTLTKYMAKKKRRTKASTLPIPDMSPADVRHDKRSRVRDIYHIFAVMQKSHGAWVLPLERDQRMRTCFRKLAAQLDALEAAGPPIDIALYVQAHKEMYGKTLRPHHLIGRWSIDIYATAMSARAAEEVCLTPTEEQAYDEALVKELAACRGESPEEVRQLLERCAIV